MSKVCVFDHPLIQHKLSILRDENTSVKYYQKERHKLQGVPRDDQRDCNADVLRGNKGSSS